MQELTRNEEKEPVLATTKAEEIRISQCRRGAAMLTQESTNSPIQQEAGNLQSAKEPRMNHCSAKKEHRSPQE